MRRGADLLAVDRRTLCAFDVRDEVALRPTREHGDLHAGLAERGEGLGELELLARIAAREKLDRPERLPGLCWGRCGCGRRGCGCRRRRGCRRRGCWRRCDLGTCVLVGD